MKKECQNVLRWIALPIVPFLAVAVVEIVSIVVKVLNDVVASVDFSAPHKFYSGREGFITLVAMIAEGAVFVWSSYETAPKFKTTIAFLFAVLGILVVAFMSYMTVKNGQSISSASFACVSTVLGIVFATVAIFKKDNSK